MPGSRAAHIVDHVNNFPEQCRFILELLAVPFKTDAEAKRLGLDPKQRLHFHKEHSGPAMAKLHKWLNQPFKDHGVEPNSGLGQAMKYLLTHWRKLTLFSHCGWRTDRQQRLRKSH